MRIDSYSHAIENYFGELRLVVTAYNKRLDQYFDFFRVYESGKKECRNLYFSCYGFYSITYPGAYACSYYGERADNHYIEEDWGECTINHVGYERGNLNHIGDINLILKKYPDFVYTLKKWRGELYYMTGTLPVICGKSTRNQNICLRCIATISLFQKASGNFQKRSAAKFQNGFYRTKKTPPATLCDRFRTSSNTK